MGYGVRLDVVQGHRRGPKMRSLKSIERFIRQRETADPVINVT